MKTSIVLIAAAIQLLAFAGVASADCESDADCKGGRKCMQGQCADAPAAAPADDAQCRKDIECKGDRVCEDGKCVSPKPGPATVAAAPERAAPAETTTATASRSLGVSVAAGPWFPGSVDVGEAELDTEMGYVLRAAVDGYVIPQLSMGAYFVRGSTSLKDVSDSSVAVNSFGGVIKGVFGRPGAFQFRPGVALGYQTTTAEVGGEEQDDIKGFGVSALAEAAIPLSREVNALVMLSFISQPTGGNDDVDVTWAPIMFLAGGIEYCK